MVHVISINDKSRHSLLKGLPYNKAVWVIIQAQASWLLRDNVRNSLLC